MTIRREITEEELEQALERPYNFGGGFAYGGDNGEMFETWSIGPVLQTRDSGIRAESNREAILASLREAEEQGEIEKDSWGMINASDWGCGWVEHLTFKACDENREPTQVFALIMELNDCIAEHGVLDSSDHSRREYEAQHESIERNAPYLKDDLPEDWPNKVWSWLWDNRQSAFENQDRTYIDGSDIEVACEALDFLEPEED